MDKYPNVVKTKECIYLVSFTRERILQYSKLY